MKTIIPFLFSLLLTTGAVAQQLPSPDSTENKFFIGAGVSTTGYYLIGKSKYEYIAGVTPYIIIHYGYNLSKRASIQVGLGYGANETSMSGSRYVSANEIYEVQKRQNLKALVVPVTFKFTPLNPHRKFQLYTNAALAPTIGRIKASATESNKGSTSELYDEETSAFNVVATAGLTLNYKMTSRIEGFIDGMLFYKNLHRRGRLHHQRPKSVGIGLNYKL